jgi:hypothetical protein
MKHLSNRLNQLKKASAPTSAHDESVVLSRIFNQLAKKVKILEEQAWDEMQQELDPKTLEFLQYDVELNDGVEGYFAGYFSSGVEYLGEKIRRQVVDSKMYRGFSPSEMKSRY